LTNPENLLSKISVLNFKMNNYLGNKSIFFNRTDIRDLIFKGYVIVYKIDEKENEIQVFGFSKYKEHL